MTTAAASISLSERSAASDLTSEEALLAAGYTHRPGGMTGRDIVRIADGVVVARLKAHEVWAWLADGGAAAPIAPRKCISPQTAAAFFRFGFRSMAKGYLEPSANLISWDIARDVIEAHGKDTSPSNVDMYLRGMATAIIGVGT